MRFTSGYETTGLELYDKVAKGLSPEDRKLVGTGFLGEGELPERSLQGGKRGRAMAFAIPQRERAEGQGVDGVMLGRENGVLRGLVEVRGNWEGELVLQMSEKEKNNDALWLRERGRCPEVAGKMVSLIWTGLEILGKRGGIVDEWMG